MDGGECARHVQHYLWHIDHTSAWRPGENVIDVLASGRQIEQGTANVAAVQRHQIPNACALHRWFP